MSKMMAPDMEVIRFNEADVIVASGGVPQKLRMEGWADNKNNNLEFTYGGKTYDYSNRNDFLNLLELNSQSDKCYDTASKKTNYFSVLYNNDQNDHYSNIGANGEYVWNKNNGRWEH